MNSELRTPNSELRSPAFGFPRVAATLALLSLICVDEAAAATIQLRASAEVGSTVITLGDVATVTDRDANRGAQLQQIMLAPAPAAGRTLRLDFATIRSCLAAHGVNLADIEFSGRSIVTVTASSKQESAQPRLLSPTPSRQLERAEQLVARAVQQHLRRQAPELGDVELSLRIRPQDVPVILSSADSGYEIRGGKPPWNLPQELAVLFRDQQKRLREVRVQCRVKQRPQVLTVGYSVPAGHVLQKGDLVLSQVERTAGALTRPEEVLGKQTRRAIRQGQPIRSADVQSIPLVHSGDVVTVCCRCVGVTVRCRMKARNDGTRGETITLVSLDGRKKVLATVVGYREAEVIGSSGPPTEEHQDSTGKIRFQPARVARP